MNLSFPLKKLSTRDIGKKGEALAEAFLTNLKYRILESNVHKRLGEIDLIVRDPQTREIAFVEVKSRKNNEFGTPEAFVNRRKMLKIQKTALLWLTAHNHQETDVRIDVIAIETDVQPPLLLHFKNVGQQ